MVQATQRRVKRVLVSWSSGKDSAWALWQLQQDAGVELCGLLTTFNQAADRVAMHAVRRELVRRQSQRAGLELWEVELPSPCTNQEYEARMQAVIERAQATGVTHIAFGDLFLQDIRAYRERMLEGTGIEPLFPVWQMETRRLSRTLVDAGVVAHLTCVDPKQLDPKFVGRRYDHSLLDDLPAGVDPCGENGEFHTLVSAGPMFSEALDVRVGERIERDGFWFADVMPSSNP